MEENLFVRLNAMRLSSVSAFTNIKGGYNNGTKDVYFLRLIGFHSENDYLDDIGRMDGELAKRQMEKLGGYVRISKLPTLMLVEDAEYYKGQYDNWLATGKNKGEIRYHFQSLTLQNAFWKTVCQLEQLYRKLDANANDSILKNFIVKIMYWADLFLPMLYESWNEKISPKLVLSGKIKRQEYLFLYFLTQIGTDILYLNSEEDLQLEKQLMDYSSLLQGRSMGKINIPAYDRNRAVPEKQVKTPIIQVPIGQQPTPVRQSPMPARQQPTPVRQAPAPGRRNPSIVIPPVASRHGTDGRGAVRGERRQLDFEELAMLAASVVMISVHDGHGKCFKTGSGMMISNQGYILTNHHVACEGSYYSVRIEDNEEAYHSDEMIKYNYLQDLALIRIDRKCNPIPLYDGKQPLVRGQKVVAIGSPLGMFNSVSEGIISGFRDMEDVTMIQFTAPTSHGSSGGALLNMYGEIIGISTAGLDDGQNLNLAVNYEAIATFVRGFL